MIHREFSEQELASAYADPEAVRAHPDIRRFAAWVRRQPPEYGDWPNEPLSRRRRIEVKESPGAGMIGTGRICSWRAVRE
ncbi:MAG: hypothetical protein ACFCUT_11885 [Kiloniellaceae bacterium]